MTQEFRIFKEYPAYEVSSAGYLRRRLPGRGTWVGRTVNGAIRKDGYLQVFGFKPFNLMHQIVAHVFLGPCPPGMEPNHKNLKKYDCAADNLEYLTHVENSNHGIKTSGRKVYNQRDPITGRLIKKV